MDPAQCCSWGFKKVLLAFGVLILVILLWTWVSSPMVVTVTGTGEVSVPATSATVSFSISSQDTSAQGAIAGVKGKVDAVKQMLKASGISEEDIVESQLTVVPASLITQGASGFQAQVVMSAKTIHVTAISDLISNLYNQGVAVVSQPVLAVEKVDELEAKAMDQALKDARSKASKIALKNWKLVKKMIALTQQSSASTATATSKADTLTEANNQQAAQNGVFKIVKAVSVSYKMW